MGGRLNSLQSNCLQSVEVASAFAQGLLQGGWIQLHGPHTDPVEVPEVLLPTGSGVVLASGGSSGGQRFCLHPVTHLDRSAAATARWLQAIGIAPELSLVLNPLPFHHVSGLMPWWRSRCWGAEHAWLMPEWMKHPAELIAFCKGLPSWQEGPALLSLVPTQLSRLLADPLGLAWLQQFAVIWVGGAALSDALAERARAGQVKLSPCYGATETAAMVTALPPDRFLAGESGCGPALVDVELRVDADGALQVRLPRLAIGSWRMDQPDLLSPLTDSEGWWRSGDRAELVPELHVLGRLDGAIHSGGETVFPEQLEARLMEAAQGMALPVDAVLLLGVEDPEWGDRLVALVRSPEDSVLERLEQLTMGWPAAERPRRWLLCPDLAPTQAGKWQRAYWRHWLVGHS